MSKYGNEFRLRQRERDRSSSESRKRQEEEREIRKRNERAEQEFNVALLELREQIPSVEDLHLLLKDKKLLLYADLTQLREREQFLLNRLANLAPAEIDNAALRAEIVEYNRLYNDYAANFHDQTIQAKFELSRKQNRLKEHMQMASREIMVLNRLIEELITDPAVQLWFASSLKTYSAQLQQLVQVLQRLRSEPENLLNSLTLVEQVRKIVRRIRTHCDSFREKTEKLDAQKDDPNDFLFLEPYYYRKPKERIPPRVLAKVQALERFSR